MLYQRKSFTLPVSSTTRDPATCSHGWVNGLGRCQWCNTKVGAVAAEALAPTLASEDTEMVELEGGPLDGMMIGRSMLEYQPATKVYRYAYGSQVLVFTRLPNYGLGADYFQFQGFER